MAKVTGPLFSMDARNKFGNALVFSGWKGRSVVRRLVTPSNPHSANQESARNRVRAAGAIQHVVNLTTEKGAARLLTDKDAIKAITPAGYAWNGFLTDTLVGSGAVNYAAAQAAWAALAAGEKTAWSVAAEGLTIPYATAINQTTTGGGTTTALTTGNAFFLHTYALFLMGIASAPGAVPPVYA
jgi:hypothetical protein